jgi:predicted SnoaL-like aldol condensation-catalyzing enzyme
MHRFLALYAEAWAQPTNGRLAELWAQDAEMMHPELEEPIRGRDAVMAYLQWFLELAPDLTVRPLAAAANGDTIFIHFRNQATIAGERLVWRA